MTVVAAKGVDFILLTYVDDTGRQLTQPALVGENHVHLIDAKTFGFSPTTTPQGPASDWLKKAVFTKLGRKI